MAEAAAAESQYELTCRLAAMHSQGKIDRSIQESLQQEGEMLLRDGVLVIPEIVYAPLEQEARRRLPQDPDGDWPTVALALVLEVGVWTEDRDFLAAACPFGERQF